VTRSGTTLGELVVALALLGLVAGIVHRTVGATIRLAAAQARAVEVNTTLRAAALILAEEFRPLDPAGGDLVAIGPGEITYRAVRSVYAVCGVSHDTHGIVSLHRRHLGSRALDPELDSLLIYHEFGDRWLAADLVSAAPGRGCPGGTPSLDVRVDGPVGAPSPAPAVGAPVQGFEVAQARTYRDSRGQWWLGMRRLQKHRYAWPAIQPVLGPLAAHGVEFRFLDRDGRPTPLARGVARIDVVVRAVSSDERRSETGQVVLSVTPRNNPRR
jgi:hypothetical protein